jgi:hypothetical protein
MTHPGKLPTSLIAIPSVVSFRAAENGVTAAAQKPVRRKAHGRPAHSLPTYGRAFFNKALTFGRFDLIQSLLQSILLLKQHSSDARSRHESGARDLACVVPSAIQLADQWSKAVALRGRLRVMQCEGFGVEKEIRIGNRHEQAFNRQL